MQWLLRRKSAIAVLLFACSSILSAAPRLVLSPSAIGPIYITPGTNGPVQTLTASNAGDGILTITTVSTSASWLAASVGVQTACAAPLTGVCYPISISLKTASLAAGSYTEYVTVIAPASVVDAPQQVPVSIVVTNVPSNVTLYVAPNGGTGGTASVSIYPRSAINSTIVTQSGGGWLTIAAPTGVTAFGTPYAITATSQPGQAAGTYTGTVTTFGSPVPSDNQTINVTLNVTSSPIIQVNNQNVLLSGYVGGPPVTDVINFTNMGTGTLNITGANVLSSVNSLFSLNVTGTNSITLTAKPANVPAGIYTGMITLTSNAANSAQVSIPVELTVSPFGTPTISQSGVVNIATFQADTLAPGDIGTIFGDQFTAVGVTITNPTNLAPNSGFPQLETRLGGVQVLVNGVPAPLYFASRQQINFQVPYELVPGQTATVQVVANGVNSSIRSAQVATAAPRILVWPTTMVQGNYGIVVNNNDNTNSLPAPGLGTSRPSHPGDIIVIYGVGFGQTGPAAVTGAFATATPLETITPNATVTFGTGANQVQATAIYTGLTPTAVGLYQIDVTIPANAPVGNSIPLQLNVNGATSNVVNMAIASN